MDNSFYRRATTSNQEDPSEKHKGILKERSAARTDTPAISNAGQLRTLKGDNQ